MRGDILLGVFIFLIGLKVLHSGYRRRKSLLFAKHWPTADGRIESSEFFKNEKGIWIPEIRYSYWVDGNEYRSSVVHADSEMNVGFTDRFAREKVEKHPTGKTVVVHYNPEDRRMAFLETTSSAGTHLWIGVGLVLMVAGLLIAAIPSSG